MRILLTGDKGYIGAVMVPMLLQEGHSVTGLDSDLFEHSAFTPLLADIPSRKKDLRDLKVSDLEGFDAVIHLAGLSNDPLGDLNPALTYDINHWLRSSWRSWRKKPERSDSCFPRPAAPTARPRAKICSTSMPNSTP